MIRNPQRNSSALKNSIRDTASSTFYSTRGSIRQYASMRKKYSGYSETLYSSHSPTPSPQKHSPLRVQKSSLSPTRKCAYWQNWLLPEGVRRESSNQEPNVSASAMCALFADSDRNFLSHNEGETRQIASLTKIMTAFTVVNICNTYGLKYRETWVRVEKEASMIEGTSANLRHDEELLVIDLLYGLLLPSGNDAAYALAQYFGKFLSYAFVHEKNGDQGEQSLLNFMGKKDFYDQEYKDQSIKLFVFEMNKNAHTMGLKRTQFANPTGLTDIGNFSTARDMCLLISFCLRNHLLRSIFKKKSYVCVGRNTKMATTRQIEWRNTNKHLFHIRDCIGVKTGITPGAGPCLSTAYRILGRELIVVVLNSRTLEDRYTDSEKIYRYARALLQKEQQEGQDHNL